MTSKYKKIYLFNFIEGEENKNFEILFKNVAKENNIEAKGLNSKDCIIIAKQNAVSVIHNNEVVDFSDSYAFVKQKALDSYRVYLMTKIFDHLGVPSLNPANSEHQYVSNKMTMMVKLSLVGIKTPDSVICDENAYYKNKETILKEIKFPCVVKFSGSRGKQVWLIKTIEELEFKLSELGDDMAIVQEYIENDHDIRVFVLGDKVLAAIKRSSADGFYNNLSQGGKGEAIELTEEEKEICVQATKEAQLTLAGVDLLRLKGGGNLIFEVNKNPQIAMFEEYTDVPLQETIAKRVINKEV